MASQYRQPASTTRRRAEWRIALLLGLLAGPAAAAAVSADEGPALRPYIAHYKTTARGFDLRIRRELKTADNGDLVLTSGGKMLVFGFQEISVFRIENDRIRSGSYVYQGTGMVSRRKEIHFTPEQQRITSLYKGKWYELPYCDTTLDRMNQVEQLRLMLLAEPVAPRAITLRVADGKRVKDSRLALIGRETLQTAMGPVDTVHYERLHENTARKSDLWFAPGWDFLMVRTVHIESGDPVEMILTDAAIDGEPFATH